MWGKLFRILLCVAFWVYIFIANARSVEEDRVFFCYGISAANGRALADSERFGQNQTPIPIGEKMMYITTTTAAPAIAHSLPVFHGDISMTCASGISKAALRGQTLMQTA